MRLRQWLVFLTFTPLLFGFRVFPGGARWNLDRDNPTLWIRLCNEPALNQTDLPADDPLSGTTVDFAAILRSIIDDYNNVEGSFIRLALYPADPSNPGAPADGDSPFTEEAARERTIDICFNTQIFTGGYTKQEITDTGRVVGCEIKLDNSQVESARGAIRVLTHELGHCLGLDHPQETTRAVMSYFSGGLLRLQIDDKMGLVHLFPATDAYGKETPTLGFACTPK